MTTTEDPLWGHPQVARLARAGRRLQRFDRERPWAFDALVVLAALLLFALPDLLHQGHRREGFRIGSMPLVGAIAIQLALTLPLLWRRRAPETVLAVVGAVFLFQWSLNVWLHSDVALMIALYSVARHGRLRRLPWACGAVAAVLLLPALQVSAAVSWVVALFFLYSAATAAAALGLAVRVGRAYLDALRDRAARLEVERDQRSRLAAAAERSRVAREMHDIIGHNLSVIIGLADGGAYAADVAPERSKQALTHIAATGRQALDELRRMLGVLSTRPGPEPDPDAGVGLFELEQAEQLELSPQPGVADLDALCERVRSAGPDVVYRTVGHPDALEPGVQLMLYRIVQESLTNTLKHAGPDTTARLTLVAEADETRVRVEDTGPARTAPRPPNGEGRGITGMRERAVLYGGTLTAGPRPGGGWAVEAVLTGAVPTGAGGAG